MTTYDTRHGSPYDRGAADAYYHRERRPHYFVKGTYASKKVTIDEMTQDEIAAYDAGYADVESSGDGKEWD